MKHRNLGTICLCVLIAGTTLAADEQREKELAARAEAIKKTLANINEEIKECGGSWEKWEESLKEYRDDIRGYITNWKAFGWPWPAKKGYVYQGAAVKIHLLDDFADELPKGERPSESIIHFDKQCKALGIDLIVAIIPSKLSVYPDYTYAGVEGEPRRVARVPGHGNVDIVLKRLMHRLLESDVEVVDLNAVFAAYRKKHGESAELFYVRDGHYKNLGARVAAGAIAERLKRYDFVQKAMQDNPYVGVKGSRSDGGKADPDMLIIKDKNGRAYRSTRDSPVILLGDSHFGYNQSRSAGTGAQVARLIGMPVTVVWKEGLSTHIPVQVARDRMLRKRKVIIMHYTERMMRPSPGKKQWPIVNLPGAPKPGTVPSGMPPDLAKALGRKQPPWLAKKKPEAAAAAALASCTVKQVSQRPDTKADYPHFVMKFYVTGLADSKGAKIGTGDAVLAVLAMYRRTILGVARTREGAKLKLKLVPWRNVEKDYGKIQSGGLPDPQLEVEKTMYWGEITGQPRLTADDLKKLGQDDIK